MPKIIFTNFNELIPPKKGHKKNPITRVFFFIPFLQYPLPRDPCRLPPPQLFHLFYLKTPDKLLAYQKASPLLAQPNHADK